MIYHNSLPPGASVSPDIRLGHHSLGTVIHTNVVIGRRVKIWQNVTIAVRSGAKSPYRVYIEDDVNIGANSVIISPYRADLRIGQGARIGAGAVVTRDVPAGRTIVCAPARLLPQDAPGEGGVQASAEANEGGEEPGAEANGSVARTDREPDSTRGPLP